jgi:hypothetical protein
MRLAELQQALRAADPAAVLVAPRVLDRLIQSQHHLSTLFSEVPHRKCYIIDRPTLLRYVDQDELDLEPDRLLPATLILLARPSPNTLTMHEREEVLLLYWRRLFHASIHLALDKQVAEGRLTLAMIRDRIEQIGASEFAEIRMVLEQEKYLLPSPHHPAPPPPRAAAVTPWTTWPEANGREALTREPTPQPAGESLVPAEPPPPPPIKISTMPEFDLNGIAGRAMSHPDEQAVYIEFAAVYLELRYFAASLLPIYFPGLSQRDKIDQLLAQDVDAAGLFARTRLAGASDPVVRTDTSSDESHDYYWKLVRSAEEADTKQNTVRAAILRTRAARVAPASLAETTHARAEEDLQRLTRRLQAALELSDSEAAEWLKDLPALLDKADQGTWPVEAAMLYDLQKVGVDHERDIFALDLVVWLASGGIRPIKRPLPSQRLVRITKHLRSAAQRLTMARLSDEERQHLGRLLQTALDRCEDRLRNRFRPVLNDALLNVGLQPSNPPEQAAFARMIEELLDRITEFGFLTFSDLRDTISRNQLKLPDLADAPEFLRGDPLLRMDRRLATALDGVYRPGELYLRWLERCTAPAFGTATGRWFTLFIILPFGGAAVFLQILHILLRHLDFNVAGFDPISSLQQLRDDQGFPLLGFSSWLLLGFFLLALLHIDWVWESCQQGLQLAWRGLRTVLVDWPVRVFRLQAVQEILKSWTFLLFWSFVFKPLVVCLLLWRLVPDAFATWLAGCSTFLTVNFALNTRLGIAAGEAVLQAFVDFYDLLRAGLLPGMFRLVLWVFKRSIDTVEYVLYSVDEWLRFRSGDSQLSMVVRTIAGLFWYPVAFLARFYLIVLIEPGFNPIKAPVSYLAAKIMAIWLPMLTYGFAGLLEQVLGKVLAWLIAAPTIWLLPDMFGFLFWETKENWRMYRANRDPVLRPVAVGPHGETIRQLLNPGFHSGTIPKLYTRLREAEREAIQSGSWRHARTYRRTLAEVQSTIRRLVERELVCLLQESSRWHGEALRVGAVTLTPNRIRLDLVRPAVESSPLSLEWETQAGWLVAAIRDPGWLAALDDEQRQAIAAGLGGLYKLAGIDLIREQVRANLPPPATSYQLTHSDLVLWVNRRQPPVILYDLTAIKGPLRPHTLDGELSREWPVLEPARLIFARVPLSWQRWVENWQNGSSGKMPPPLFSPGVKLLPSEATD